MSIASEILRISQNVSDSLDAVAAKGVTVPSGSNSDDLAELIALIPTGSGGGSSGITQDENGYIILPKEGGGSSGGSVVKKDVNFIDYDGTLLYSYTKAEINAMTLESDLPANPSHSGLVAQGWNWTLAQIKAQLTAIPDGPVWVGQMYITESGDTEIDVEFSDSVALSPNIPIAVDGEIEIDWGDNTSTDRESGTSLTSRKSLEHTFSTIGRYTIKIHVISGSFIFYTSSSYNFLYKNTTSNENRVYTNCVKAVRIGSGVAKINSHGFLYCYSLAYITIPSNITSFGNNAFQNCYSLSSITIPSGADGCNGMFYNCYALKNVAIPFSITTIGNNYFAYCTSLISITIPNSVTTFGINAFQNCCSLSSIIIPSGVTIITSNMFDKCYSIQNVILSNNITSIGDAAFRSCYSLRKVAIPSGVTNIGDDSFSGCFSLTSLTIPSGVINIGNTTFENCYGITNYHVEPATAPTNGTSVFSGIIIGCIIYVPYSADHSILNAYKAATNWSTYASYMQEEPQ